MKVAEFSYELPLERIAQRPLPERDASRLLVLERSSGNSEDRQFGELPELVRGDELIAINNARVFPARVFGRRRGLRAEPLGPRSRLRRQYLTAPIEALLVRRVGPDETWEALVRPGRKVRVGEVLVFGEGELDAEP